MEFRMRLPAALGQRVHKYALEQNREFSNAGAHLVARGLAAESSPAPNLKRVADVVDFAQDVSQRAATAAAALRQHAMKTAAQPELSAYLARLSCALAEFGEGIEKAKAAHETAASSA